jgi:peroxiredoxin
MISLLLALPCNAAEKGLAFSLPDLDGNKHTLADYRGKVVVLDFWAVWCITCRGVFPMLNELREKYSRDKIAVIGISIDEKPAAYVKKFVERSGLAYTILHDPSGGTPAAFGIKALPTLFVLRKDGTAARIMTGIEGKNGKKEIFRLVQELLTAENTNPQAEKSPAGEKKKVKPLTLIDSGSGKADSSVHSMKDSLPLKADETDQEIRDTVPEQGK